MICAVRVNLVSRNAHVAKRNSGFTQIAKSRIEKRSHVDRIPLSVSELVKITGQICLLLNVKRSYLKSSSLAGYGGFALFESEGRDHTIKNHLERVIDTSRLS